MPSLFYSIRCFADCFSQVFFNIDLIRLNSLPNKPKIDLEQNTSNLPFLFNNALGKLFSSSFVGIHSA